MIPTLSVMIGLYIIARYCEMGKTSNIPGKIGLGILAVITIYLMWTTFLQPAITTN